MLARAHKGRHFLEKSLLLQCVTKANEGNFINTNFDDLTPVLAAQCIKRKIRTDTPTGASTNPKNFDLNKNLNMNVI